VCLGGMGGARAKHLLVCEPPRAAIPISARSMGGDAFCGSGVRSGAGNALSSLDMASKSRKTHTRKFGFPCSTGKGLLVNEVSQKEVKSTTRRALAHNHPEGWGEGGGRQGTGRGLCYVPLFTLRLGVAIA